jgi:hypothetical protein
MSGTCEHVIIARDFVVMIRLRWRLSQILSVDPITRVLIKEEKAVWPRGREIRRCCTADLEEG